MSTFEQLTALLDAQQTDWTLIEHAAVGQTEQISAIRGNALHQAAKAVVLAVVMPERADPAWLLAIVPGDCKINAKAAARAIGGKKASFAPPEVAGRLTGCVMGAVPPFSFHADLALRVDHRLREAGTLYFNAGVLDKSVALPVADYFRMVGESCCASIATAVAENPLKAEGE